MFCPECQSGDCTDCPFYTKEEDILKMCPNELCNGSLLKLHNSAKMGTSYQCNVCREKFCIKHPKSVDMPRPEDIIKILERANLDPYVYHVALTGSFYIKFKLEGMRSLRVGDHNGKIKYSYKWNLRTDIDKSYETIDRGIKRFFYHIDDIQKMVSHMKAYERYAMKKESR